MQSKVIHSTGKVCIRLCKQTLQHGVLHIVVDAEIQLDICYTERHTITPYAEVTATL